ERSVGSRVGEPDAIAAQEARVNVDGDGEIAVAQLFFDVATQHFGLELHLAFGGAAVPGQVGGEALPAVQLEPAVAAVSASWGVAHEIYAAAVGAEAERHADR